MVAQRAAILVFAACLIGSLIPVSGKAQPVFRLEKSAGFQKAYSTDQEDPRLLYTDVLQYDVDLEIPGYGRPLRGRVRMRFVSKTDNLSDVLFHLHFQMSIDSIRTGGRRIPFAAGAYQVVAQLPTPIASGDTAEIEIFFRGQPGNDGFGGFFDRQGFIYTVGEGIYTYPPSMTHFWIPCKDVPWDKAQFHFRISVPAGLFVGSNGVLKAVEKDSVSGLLTYLYEGKHPMATYLAALAIAPYQVLRDSVRLQSGRMMPLYYYVPSVLMERAERDFSTVPDMVRIFEERFGPYPFEQYAMAVAPMRGAMEHQTMTTYSNSLLTGDMRFEAVVAHELAHQWWGDWVTLRDWEEIWLNEGFASYGEIIYFEARWPEKDVRNLLREKAFQYFQEVEDFGAFPVAKPDFMWGATVYEKGAWVLHMLRDQIGEERFWEVLRRYGDRFAYGNARIGDFMTVVNEVTGQNWDWFFLQWLYRPDFPQVTIRSYYEPLGDGSRYRATLAVEQVQASKLPYRFPLEVAFVGAADTAFSQFEVQSLSEMFQDTLDFLPLSVVPDPHLRVLGRFQILSGDQEPVVPRSLQLSLGFPNPFVGHFHKWVRFEVLSYRTLQHVQVSVFDLRGRKIRDLMRGELTLGKHFLRWDGRDETGKMVPSGVYFLILSSPSAKEKRKIVFVH